MHDSFRRYIKRQRDKFLLFSKIMFRRKNASREVKLVCHIHLHLLIKQNFSNCLAPNFSMEMGYIEKGEKGVSEIIQCFITFNQETDFHNIKKSIFYYFLVTMTSWIDNVIKMSSSATSISVSNNGKYVDVQLCQVLWYLNKNKDCRGGNRLPCPHYI